MFGVPGIVGSVCVPLREGEVSRSMWDASWVFKLEGVLELDAEDRRLRWENDPLREEEKEEGFKDARSRLAVQRAREPSGDFDEVN
jgi:hypothetical protein